MRFLVYMLLWRSSQPWLIQRLPLSRRGYYRDMSSSSSVPVTPPSDDDGDDANEVLAKSFQGSARFTPPTDLPGYKWKPPNYRNPAEHQLGFFPLVTNDYFIDKSAVLFSLLKDLYDKESCDFRSTCIRLVYPRRFGKSILLSFIRTAFTPIPETYFNFQMKIATFERGKDLLAFGMHPVILVTMSSRSSVDCVKSTIEWGLHHAGLELPTIKAMQTPDMSPAELLVAGANMLNDNFERRTGVTTKTIVMIDGYDSSFRNKSTPECCLSALINVYSLGGRDNTGISLLVLSGLTRMVESDPAIFSSCWDVSRMSKYHGLCGVSARELVKCANGQLDCLAQELYDGQTFEQIVCDKYGREWNGFRFGLDTTVGELDPNSPEGLLFCPFDAWGLVESLFQSNTQPSSYWLDTMTFEFEFSNFADCYTLSPEGSVELYRNLYGGWVDVSSPDFKMKREDYFVLRNNIHVKQLLLELGLLTVKEINGNVVRLGSPNPAITKSAVDLMWKELGRVETPELVAREHLSNSGFRTIVSGAASEASAMCRGVCDDVLVEFPFEEYLYTELLYHFPDECTCMWPCKDPLSLTKYWDNNPGRLILVVDLKYDDKTKMAFIIEIKLSTIENKDNGSINAAHARKIQKAIRKLQRFKWRGETEQRVVVSGVWYPKDDAGRMELSAAYEFLEPTPRPMIEKI